MIMNKFKIILPGLLVAATGVGAGDLITAGFAGNALGYSILLLPFLGALFKYVLSEGLSRWQIATNTTLLEGWVAYHGSLAKFLFLLFLVLWSYMVGGALINACAAAAQSFFSFENSFIYFGILHSLFALLLVRLGNFKLFEMIMSVLVAVMFLTVIFTSVLFVESWEQLLSQMFSLNLPALTNSWGIGVLGGVGGTLTILSYSYWMKEAGREGDIGLKYCRIDLAVSYFLTALFSFSMIIIGKNIDLTGASKALYPLKVALLFDERLGDGFGNLFLIGFWCGVLSSLLGVWQSVPYLFADLIGQIKNEKIENLNKTGYYKNYLYLLAIIPLTTLWIKFESIQKLYAIVGALFMPILALSLLYLGNLKSLAKFKNSWLANSLLVGTLIIFALIGYTGS
jgi:Mn2+/Fe2+ NRAMP family transporter